MSSDLRLLLVGNGGREHALAWKLAQSSLVSRIYVCPGNGGTASNPKCINIDPNLASDYGALVQFALQNSVELLIPGPEAPLVDGITDYFRQHAPQIKCFGPSKAAAVMEGSKTFSKDFMKRHNIPTAAYENFSDYKAATAYIDSVSHRVVIKATGLAAGKGVILPTTKEEAHAALKDMMLVKSFGDAGDEVVIEEFLEGDEISILSMCDGETFKSLPPAQDHKRIFDNDRGPNTGGMGTYAPAPTRIVSKQVLEEIDRTILQPTINGMKKEGFPMVGCLFTGYMITPNSGPKLLEYNVRFGDPETQSILPLLKTDLASIMLACTTNSLSTLSIDTSDKSAATVVVAAGGYPESYEKNIDMMVSKPSSDDVVIFHAGTRLSEDGKLLTNGGRVIAATAVADTLARAVDMAYEGVGCIQFEGMQYRRDIGARALK